LRPSHHGADFGHAFKYEAQRSGPRPARRRLDGVCHTRCGEDLSADGALLVLTAVLVVAARRSGNGLP
jgi:hypothetical protein